MDDSGIIQVLGLLSEPSLPTTERKKGGRGGEDGGRQASQLCPGWHSQRESGAPPLQFLASPVFLNANTSEKDDLIHSGTWGEGRSQFFPKPKK